MPDILDRFKDPATARLLAEKLGKLEGEAVSIMEVCGTHTMAIFRYGIRSLLPESIRLVSGPGCPVCVTPVSFINAAIQLAKMKDVTITTFGDLMKVPGSYSTLIDEKRNGADIRIVYSPLDALDIAADEPSRRVVFLSVGFETTAPVSALAVLRASERGLRNFSMLSANKTMPQAMRIIAGDGKSNIDGFLYPGHVCAITGTSMAKEIALEYGVPGVVTGFEPLDVLHGIISLTELIRHKENTVLNEYKRIVREEGNPTALERLCEVFEPCDAVWRGFGSIPRSGLAVRAKYSGFDAWKVFGLREEAGHEPEGCMCPMVLTGRVTPDKCRLFGRQCTPESPVGACMVSSEGTCAAYYRYGTWKPDKEC
ncbi:MAG TPA: hydrogenase formation protein HypD [Clostridia bacterium]|nr:hydrogenase formation protein HypD [Clostridia bacterium]